MENNPYLEKLVRVRAREAQVGAQFYPVLIIMQQVPQKVSYTSDGDFVHIFAHGDEKVSEIKEDTLWKIIFGETNLISENTVRELMRQSEQLKSMSMSLDKVESAEFKTRPKLFSFIEKIFREI